MRTSFVTVLLGAAFVVACSDSSGPTTSCGENTQSVNGRCETLITCGDGTVLVNNICQPEAGAGACGEGTQNVDGRCVPSDAACDTGTRLVDGECVPDFAIVCGAGTQENDAGECELVLELECGPGTDQETISDDEGKTEVAVCVLLCTGDTIYDESIDACVDACTDGSEFDVTTNTCRALCADDEFFSTTVGDCVDVPVCLRNAFDENADDAGGDCAGWPFHELTLETVCARRAFNVCDAIFDPACNCDHGGDYLGGGDGGTLLDVIPADIGHCLLEEMQACELVGVGVVRALANDGQVTADTAALEQLDDYYALPEGVCTRPSDWDPWPQDLFSDLVDGAVALDGECQDQASCRDNGHCRFPPRVIIGGLAPPDFGLCFPRVPVDDGVDEPELCNSDERDLESSGTPGFIGISLSGIDSSSARLCEPGLRCLFNESEQRVCQQPRVLGASCGEDSDCEDGLFCFPADLDRVNGPAYVFDNPPTCQAPQSEGVGCMAFQRSAGGVQFVQDVCAPNLRCDDSARSAPTDGVGQCVAAIGTGQPCDYCSEYQIGGFFFGQEIQPFWQDPFTVCGGDLICTFEALTEGFSETCEDAISVCPPQRREVEALGGVCIPFEFVCDDELDEDGDGLTDCEDARDCCFQEVCADDPNCDA